MTLLSWLLGKKREVDETLGTGYLFSMKRVRRSLRVSMPSVPVIVISYLSNPSFPTVVERVVVTVRVEVAPVPWDRVMLVGLRVGSGGCIVVGETEVERLMVP